MREAVICKKNFTRIINDLLSTRKDLFEELDQATQIVDAMKDTLTTPQVEMFINYIKSKSHHKVDRYTVWGLRRKAQGDNWRDCLSDSEMSGQEDIEEIFEKSEEPKTG